MKKVWEYYQHAKECRSLARVVADEQQKQLLQMARNWEQLAAERSELALRYAESSPETDALAPTDTDEPASLPGK